MAGRSDEDAERSKAYVRYVLAYLSDNPEILKKLGIDSIEDLRKEKTLKSLPITKDKSEKNGKVTAKAMSNAFKCLTGPQPETLEAIYEQFSIELSFQKFKQKLKEEDAAFLAYYKDIIPESSFAQNVENSSKKAPQQPSITKPDVGIGKTLGLSWLYKRNWIVIATVLVAVIIVTQTKLFVGDTRVAKTPVNPIPLNPIPAFSKQDSSFKILLLPFQSDAECGIQDNYYEHKLIERFEDMRTKEHINIKIHLDTLHVSSNDSQAIALGKYNNADIVIWGHYEEICNPSTSNVRIQYYLLNTTLSIEDIWRSGDTDFKVLHHLDDLRKGYLQDTIDLVVNFINAESEFAKGNYAQALAIYKRIDNMHLVLDMHMEFNKMISYIFVSEYNSALARVDFMVKNDSRIKPFRHYYRGVIFSAAGEFDKSLYEYSLMPSNLEGDTLIHYKLRADEYLGKMDTLNCLNNINVYLQFYPKSKHALVIRLVCYFEMHRYTDAIADCNTILSFSPNDKDVLNWKAKLESLDGGH
ncbi:MAG: hypothetical protein MUC87_18030 [Bacteroidia bacterium]|jgi:tetratricopeptide (TPR) repeat protein|nr:hypothetical protein [Bacteroidia bacterium]